MIYEFQCDDCETVFAVHCSMADRLNPHPCTSCNSTNNHQVILGAPALGDSVRLGVRRTDDGFKEVLAKVHEKTYKSNLNDKLSR